MKKNLFSVIILAVCVANLILNAVLIFSVVPASSKTSNLIAKICQAVDLELEQTGKKKAEVDIKDIEAVDLNKGEALTINLKSNDGLEHYASVEVSVSLNSTVKGYDELKTKFTSMSSVMLDQVREVISQYSIEEAKNSSAEFQKQILTKFQDMFGEDFVVSISFGKLVFVTNK